MKQEHNGISFIIPAFNCAATIRESVQSIVETNYTEADEIVVCNDGSSDGTAEILSALEKDVPRFRAVTHRQNRGGGASRNSAVNASENDLIFCLDSDNLLGPNTVAPLKDLLLGEGADVAVFRECRIFHDDPSAITRTIVYRHGPDPLQDYLSAIDVPGGSGNYLYTRDNWHRAGGYPEFAQAMDTWGFGLRQAAIGSKIVFLENEYYLHRQGHESYWTRCKGLAISKLALQLMIPFMDQVVDADVRYMLKNWTRWYRMIEQRPVRTKKSHPSFFDRFR